jgi:HEAT repeat protein
MLSDAQVVDHLVSLLADQGSSLAKVEAITAVLGRSGSERAVAPLLRILSDEAQVAEKRALVAEGLGSLAAAAPLWWTATIGAGINYRAVTPTLSDNRNGILDHL